ncbi:phosphoribosylanthranilate isomerase [Caryophanon tenue]|uniref:N-(5'-phosphoribosyl)anthranilate isomerase n=1 Tax=Caryophanon tenue TaxID=33978 RepID=A0A1C0Y8A1_9BACL|nr:phosphoribosylanthranilate isomerase [Caryophanon tenue]OCS83392.1 N-(5'-phosphoribosyl)anthranilate isomerase [Caryophanon tenue]
MTFVKICGLTTAEHVETAVTHGANFIGFVFAPSSRQVTIEQAQQLAAAIPSTVKKVGVFVNETAQNIQHIAQAVPLDYIQYHGDETPEFIQTIGLPAIKAFSIATAQDVQQAATYDVDYYLFDAPGTDYRGGSGHTFDWSLLQHAGIPKHRVIVAGGLHAENVADAIQLVQPFGVDVSSGVETNKVKDHAKIEAFLQAAKGENL